jgi:tyrosinase
MGAAAAIRPNVEQANVGALRDAYSKMQRLSAHDNRSWVYWGEYHGFNRYDCWHHSTTGPAQGTPNETDYPYDLFLPWHRAYLHHFDHVVREQNPDAIQPWWDWTAGGVPDAYSEAEELASGPTPSMPGDRARRTRRFPGDPRQLPSWTRTKTEGGVRLLAINDLLQLSSFVDFSQQLQNIHDFIHPWTGGVDPADPNVGGDMGTIPVAAFDPIFYAHHTMVDRLWYLWQLRHGTANIPSQYLDKALAPFALTVRQVLDIGALGYEYAGSSATAGPS